MMKKILLPPSCDTGAENTKIDNIKCENIPQQSLNIDFFTATLKLHKLEEIKRFFKVENNTLSEYDYGIFGYRKHIIIGTKIKVYYDHAHNQDIMIFLSGKACREISKNYNWIKLCRFIRKYERFDKNGELIRNYNVSRFDLATDFYNIDYNIIKRMNNNVKKGLCCSKFKINTNINQKELNSGLRVSDSIRFGSRSSRISIICYDKLMERKNANYEVHSDINSWYRLEVNYMRDRSLEVFDLFTQEEYEKLAEYNSKIILNYVDFKEKGKDKNKSRLKTCKWWTELLGQTEKLRISSYNINSSLMQKIEYTDYALSKLLLKVLFGRGTNSINQLLNIGLEKFTQNDINEINQYLSDIGKPLIKDYTELKQYIKFLEYMEY